MKNLHSILSVIFLTFLSLTSFAIDHYWVGGTGNWNGTNMVSWSLSSGGVGGASIPNSTDNVFVDANSGNGNVIIATIPPSCKNLDFTGFTGTFNHNGTGAMTISGSVTLGVGMTNSAGVILTFNSSGAETITSNGVAWRCIFIFNGTGSWALQDDITVPQGKSITVTKGTFDLNGHNVTTPIFGASGNLTRTVNLGSGTMLIFPYPGLKSSGYAWSAVNSNNLTVNAGTSTIKIPNSGTGSRTFGGGSNNAYYNVWFTGDSTGGFKISGSSSFNEIRDDNVSAHAINFTAGTTQTVSSLNINGSDGSNMITLQSTTSGTAWNLVCASGTITVNNVILKDSHASGGATFIATNSIDGGGNTGWTFQ